MRPGFGIPRPSAAARRAGIHFALDFSHPEALPWIRGGEGAAPGSLVSGAIRDTSRHGWAMTGMGGFWRVTSGVATYSLPTSQGTILFLGVSATASGDPTWNRRYMYTFGNAAAWPASPWCGATDFDNVIYAGWVNGGVDGRVTASSASGAAWAANSAPLIGLSYGPAGQGLFFNGRLAGSNSFADFGNTAAGVLSAGDGDGLVIPWARSTGDAILYLLVFDQEFTPGQHARAAIDPWWWLDVPGRPSLRYVVSSVSLVGDPLSTGAPTLSTPALGQVFALSGTSLSTGAPVLSVPQLNRPRVEPDLAPRAPRGVRPAAPATTLRPGARPGLRGPRAPS